MRVTVQYKPAQSREKAAWRNAFRGEVLFADDAVILVRGSGGHSMFKPDGGPELVAWNRDSAFGKKTARRAVRVRLAPGSLEAIERERCKP